VIELRPKSDSPFEPEYLISAYIKRGEALIDLENPKAAIADFNQILGQDSPLNEDLAYIFRGVARDKLKDYSGAIADFTEAIEHPSYGSDNQQFAYHSGSSGYLVISQAYVTSGKGFSPYGENKVYPEIQFQPQTQKNLTPED
jgi:tetratricopeptide (TPR) repeat protein